MSSEIRLTEPIIDSPVATEDGWRVRETDRYFVDVLKMMFGNLRIVLTPKDMPLTYERGWCYSGASFVEVVLRCHTFDPDRGQEPAGWVKAVGTERRACANYHRSQLRLHTAYDPECPDCGNEALV